MSKVATKPKTLTAKHSYEEYSKELLQERLDLTGKRVQSHKYGKIFNEDGSLYIDYKTYKKILSLFFIKAGMKLIQGYTIDLLHGLGQLFILRIGRNPQNPRLNRTESFKIRKQLKASGRLDADIKPEEWRVFYTDEEYIRLKWYKPQGIRNLVFYMFAPAGGQAGRGFRQLMSRTISSKPQLKALYPYLPYN